MNLDNFWDEGEIDPRFNTVQEKEPELSNKNKRRQLDKITPLGITRREVQKIIRIEKDIEKK